jgi:methylaspartate ammonia-lyase
MMQTHGVNRGMPGHAPGRPSTRIAAVLAAPGWGGYFFDDQAAIKAGAARDGLAYLGAPRTSGYAAVREPAEAVCVQLVLDDGYVAMGDCASVQYAGVGGREPRLKAGDMAVRIERDLASALRGLDLSAFREAAGTAESMVAGVPGLGRAAAYGVSQALLDAAAHVAGHHLMARTIRQEWGLARPTAAIPLYAQTGEERQVNVDKMILKRVEILPHGLINTAELVGADGIALADYIRWIRGRIQALAPADYRPVLHLDVYGLIGAQASGDIANMAEIIARLETAAGPHTLRLEHPLDAGSRDGQIAAMSALRALLKQRGSRVELVADEWANTFEDIVQFAQAGAADLIQIKTPDLGSIHHAIDAVLACQRHGVGAVLGGTCAETDRSARVTAHIGMATGATQMLAKPGMGVDEGLSIMRNEIARALRLDRLLTSAA